MRRVVTVLAMSVLIMLVGAAGAEAKMYGWTWKETVEVYDATEPGAWDVPGAVAGWNEVEGLTVVMTDDQTLADIKVVEGTYPGPIVNGWIGRAYLPSGRGDGTPDGVCTIQMQVAFRGSPWAQHAAAHEVGHCLGWDHHDRCFKNSIMNAGTNCTPPMDGPGRRDLNEGRRAYR
jgi:predicted Zn-dependent protease